MCIQGLLYILNHTGKPPQIYILMDQIIKSVTQRLTSHTDSGPPLVIENGLY